MAEEAPIQTKQIVGDLRRAFREYESGIAWANARRAAFIAALFMLLGWSLDVIIITERAVDFLMIRVACAILLVGIFWRLGKDGGFLRARVMAQGIALLPILSICAMIAMTDGGNSTYYAGLILVLVGLSLLLRWSFWNSVAMIAACFASYAISVWVSPVSPDFHTLFGNSYFLFVTSVFVLAGSYFYENLRFREFCLRDEVERSRQLLESQNKQLSELDEAKTRFFGNISHELRTPLTIMLGITERLRILLGRQPGEPVIAEMTAMLEQNGLRLLKLIDDLLDLVRFDTGHGDVKRQPTPIAAHFDGLLRSLRHLAEQDRVALLWDCRSDAEIILLDRDKFDKILLNLVINAIKFTPSGGTIEAKLRVTENHLQLSVEDTGVGIPPELLPRIFERFWQVDNSSTRKFQGAGIGLSLVRSLTDAMQGEVKVESTVNKGTTFIIEMPTEAAEAENVADAEDSLKEGGNIAQLHRKAAMSIPGKMDPRGAPGPTPQAAPPPVIGRPSGKRPLVLIADDEPDIRRFLRMQMENVDVLEAADGAEALELARLRRPQLALLDHMMPEMDGGEVCRGIRANHATRGMGVIIITARADEQTKMNALQAGANDFLTKPFSTAELALRLENQLAMARVRREMADLNSDLQAALEQIKENEVLMIRNEKLSALGRMSAGIIHEINNPLNYANVGIHTLETFSRNLPEDDREDFLDVIKDIRDGVERVTQIVTDLRKFTREDNLTTGDADLVEIITRSRRMISHQTGDGIAFNLTMPDHALIRGNANQLSQVFINFFQNSIDAIEQRAAEEPGAEPGRIDVTLEPAGEGWQVTLRDNGIGIPPENLPKIFDPFFTSKDVGKGMGLGLSITHQIIESHRALIEVDSRPSAFTRFRIVFPKPGNEVEPDPDPENAAAPVVQSVLDRSAGTV